MERCSHVFSVSHSSQNSNVSSHLGFPAIILAGDHFLSLSCAPAKGHISMSVPVESDIAPLARLLIYAILPDGELIGDSAKYEVENCLPNKVGDLYFHKIFKIFLKKPWDLERHSLFSRWGDGGHGNRVTTARSYGNLIAFSAFFLSPILVHILAYCILLFLCVW